ncbi:RNA polymerase sigma factor [Isoptericola dokdonensis]|uniref:ECF RNA polymerase sigma-E factor n=1 Tax=Isoptericola dokdonensis DS-3 TaxID=1300344 RepID=A0A161I7Y7_9MICO|nr:sigma-70 family RNA polymerase sigma factor [Isoptericola dokdonensis]ANC31778.1 ECF RNA polymerase sigma-E factor [Isoptericola dokdonensis DS-3]
MHPDLDDAALWLRVRADDEAAFATLFARYHPRVLQAVAGMLADVAGADVPAVAADVLHTAWRRRSAVVVDAALWPWLRAVAVRLCANERRRCLRRRRLAARLATLDAGDLVEADHADGVAGHLALAEALTRLRPGDADVARLALMEDLTTSQVAARLRLPLGTVKSRLHRVRIVLRRHLGPTPRGRPAGPADAGTDADRTSTPPDPPTCDAGPMDAGPGTDGTR